MEANANQSTGWRCLWCHDLHVQQLCEIWSTSSRPEYKPQENASTSLMMTQGVSQNTQQGLQHTGRWERKKWIHEVGVQCPVPPNLLCDTHLIFLNLHLQSKQKITVHWQFPKVGSLESGHYPLHMQQYWNEAGLPSVQWLTSCTQKQCISILGSIYWFYFSLACVCFQWGSHN